MLGHVLAHRLEHFHQDTIVYALRLTRLCRFAVTCVVRIVVEQRYASVHFAARLEVMCLALVLLLHPFASCNFLSYIRCRSVSVPSSRRGFGTRREKNH